MSAELVIVGDLAYLPEEWEREKRRREAERQRKRPSTAEQREYQRQWRAANPGYNRDWMRRYRAAHKDDELRPDQVGSLHSLACSGPTLATGCVCYRRGTRKIRMYDQPR